MYKIIKKEDIKLSELKELKDDGVRPILLGDFTDEEKKEYYALGIYDIASTEYDADCLAKDPASYVSVIEKPETEEVVVEKEVKVSKPGIFKQPAKLVLTAIAGVAVISGFLFAYGYSNSIIDAGTLFIKSDKIQKEEPISVASSVDTSLSLPTKWEEIKVDTVVENNETIDLDTKEYVEPKKPAPEGPKSDIIIHNDYQEALEASKEDNNFHAVKIPSEDVTGTPEGEANIENNPDMSKEETSLGDRVSTDAPAPVEGDNASKPAPTPTPQPQPENPVIETPSTPADNTGSNTEPEIKMDENGDYVIVWDTPVPEEITFDEGVLDDAVAE